jgi:hypothetical protein
MGQWSRAPSAIDQMAVERMKQLVLGADGEFKVGVSPLWEDFVVGQLRPQDKLTRRFVEMLLAASSSPPDDHHVFGMAKSRGGRKRTHAESNVPPIDWAAVPQLNLGVNVQDTHQTSRVRSRARILPPGGIDTHTVQFISTVLSHMIRRQDNEHAESDDGPGEDGEEHNESEESENEEHVREEGGDNSEEGSIIYNYDQSQSSSDSA